MLRINGLVKSYKRFPVLKGLNMRIDKGDVYGFLGTNGCGKTTTMNIVCNVIAKDEGEIIFENEGCKIGYLPESPSLYRYMNAYEYLDYIGACSRYEGDIKGRTAEVLEITGMANGAERLIKGYSRGMNQRIGIAAALYSNPDLLILDEPTSALDPAGRAEVMEIIRRLASSGATIILCTHILGDVERVANKIGIIRDGVMAVEGTLNQVRAQFGTSSVISVRLRHYTPDIVNTLTGIDLVARGEFYDQIGVTLFAKDGVSEKDLYHSVVATLAEKDIVPECIEFRRLTLEQIYMSVTGGWLQQNPYWQRKGM